MASILAGRMSALRLASPASTSAPSSSSSSSSSFRSVVVRASAPAAPAQLATAAFNGAAAPSVSPLSLQVAEADTANAVVHRYVVLLNQNARAGTASTLTRAEVQGGGKKPYAQKGTGNARIGSRRTPLKPGGGVSFGPKPKDWGIKMNKKERRLAMATALQSAAADIIVVESAAMSEPKTKALVAALASVGADPMRKNVLVVATEVGDGLQRASRNVEKLSINRVSALNASDVLKADKIVVEKGALAAIQEFYGPNTRTDE